MTVLASPDSYWETDTSPPVLEEPPNDKTEMVNPPENVCPNCGEEVVRAPGARGRTPKYHPECKLTRGGSTRGSGTRTVRVTSKEREAAEQVELALERTRRGLMKAVTLISLADPYDALVLHVNSAELLENLRPVLMRFPWLREQASNATAGASIFGLVLTIFTTALPILAHHNLIPSKKLVPLLLNMPLVMLRMQERLVAQDTGEEDMGEELLARVAHEQRKKQETEMRRTAAETVSASNR